MAKKKTKEDSEKNTDKNSSPKESQTQLKKLQDELNQSEMAVRVLQDRINMNDETYYRQQTLVLLERMVVALEKLAEESPEETSSQEGKDETQ